MFVLWQVLLRDGKRWGLHSRVESLAFLGASFRTVMQEPSGTTDVELGKKVIDRSASAPLPSPPLPPFPLPAPSAFPLPFRPHSISYIYTRYPVFVFVFVVVFLVAA